MTPTDTVVSEERLTYADLREANIARQAAWCPDQVPDLSFRGNELAGETGEVCNVIKKLERERLGWRGSRDTVEHLAEELADVVICADLCALSAGIDLNEAVAAKFNATSEKVGLPHRLTTPSLPPRSSTETDKPGVREALDNSNSLFAAILHEPRPHGEIETQIAENRAAIRALSASPLTEEQSAALQDVVAERKRQVQAEGWTPEHDDGYANGEMACAAGVYALSAGSRDYRWVLKGLPCNDYLEAAMKLWPWDWAWWKPTNRRRDLVKAGALIIAEIERLDRLPRSTTGGAK